MLEIAAQYKQYNRVSDQTYWAPTLCIQLPPAGVIPSDSGDAATHGRKLYFLYARMPADFAEISSKRVASVGQALVKESFAPELVPPSEEPPRDEQGYITGRPGTYAELDGKLYRPGQPKGLFIMYKLAPSTPGTDEGWVYATTTPDGRQVTAAGCLLSCMECHRQTDRDRLYGPRWSWPTLPGKGEVPPTREAEASARQASTTASNPP